MALTEHLNPEMLQELRSVMGSDFATLLQSFLTDSRQRIDAIAAAIAAADAEALRRAAHSFKGSTSNMGAQRLAELCRQLEDIGRNGSIDGAAVLLAPLRVEFDSVQREIATLAP